jgi:hypothetical protein
MTRTFRTLLLSAAALGALATAATAAPPASTTSTDALVRMHTPAGSAGMHSTGTAQMHTASGGMAAIHAVMLADPTMQVHMAEHGVDADQMYRWHEAGRSVDEMHEMLAAQGIDGDAMEADCPMLTDDSMATMHGNGGLHSSDHHSTPTR